MFHVEHLLPGLRARERPAWLRAHGRLDRAVLAAYAAVDPEGGWDPGWAGVYEAFGAEEIVVRSEKKTGRVRESAEGAEAKRGAIEARRGMDEAILGNLLRVNLERAGVGAEIANGK